MPFRLQDVDGISLTPFEKNLEFWKQLWRVIERRFQILKLKSHNLQFFEISVT